jgi:hypothetical protein
MRKVGYVSIWSLTVPWLAIKPTVRFHQGVLAARTPFILRLASLFGYERKLLVDTVRRNVWLRIRRYWLFREEQQVPFAAIEFIHYEYSRVSTDVSRAWHGPSLADSFNWFTVALAVKGRTDPLLLFRFAGEGAVMTGASGVLVGDSIIDIEGDQESASKDFVGHLRRCLGVPVRSNLHQKVVVAMRGTVQPCSKCAARTLSEQ